MKKPLIKRLCTFLALLMLFALVPGVLSGCSDDNPLDPKNPVTIEVWHYYNNTLENAFNSMVEKFNSTIGQEKGIIVKGSNYNSVSELQKAIIASANKEVGSKELPNIFASYADTAYEAEKLNLLANLGDYLTADEQAQYLDSYIEEGKIGLNGELRIFPIAKSTELFFMNNTDWAPFAAECGLTYDDLQTREDITRVAELYYNWTDAKTPDVANDGKAFYGHDSMANFFIVSSKQFGIEIFEVNNGQCTLNLDPTVMRKIWDNYYVPFISGYFAAIGKFRSDDAKVGDLISYVGSTASVSFFPPKVEIDENNSYTIDPKILVSPYFEDGTNVMVQQGAGMVILKATRQQEYASAEFLKWFTNVDNNCEFASLSAYMPVKKEAINYEEFVARFTGENALSGIVSDALEVAFDSIIKFEQYTNKAFTGGSTARTVLDTHLQEKAVDDRAAVIALLEGGTSLSDAVAQFNTDDAFQAWYDSLKSDLEEALK